MKASRELLDWLVDEKLMEWQIYNPDPHSENYMTEEMMKECIHYIIEKIIKEMTEVQKDKLSVGYPMETEEDMIESIKNRAKIAVLHYSVKQNMPKQDPIININAF